MSNILDYLDWRGDLSFRRSSFNEVDSLILNRLSYLPLECLIKDNEEITILELFNRFKNSNKEELFILREEDIILIQKLSVSNRFKNVIISDFKSITLKESEMQFGAITFRYNLDSKIYVAFRGTDTSITGIKEDFNMNFLDIVPSEEYAIKYLESIGNKYKDKEIRLGGHSKGGRIAIFASLNQNEDISNRIKKIYNNDGPGFNDYLINSLKEKENYKRIIGKAITFIPESSLIGILFNHEEEVVIIKSLENGMKSHNIYNWDIKGTSIVRAKSLKGSSKFMDKTFVQWMKTLDIDTRKTVIDCVFEILSKTKMEKARDFSDKLMSNISTIIKGYSDLSKENKKKLKETLGLLFISIKDNALLEFKSSKDTKDKNKEHK